MFVALGLMLFGLLLGRLLRHQVWPKQLGRCISPVILLMLFCLGLSVGGNATLMGNLPRLGGQALLLTLAGVAGSLVAVQCIRRWVDQPAPHPARPASKADARGVPAPESSAAPACSSGKPDNGRP